MLTEITLNNYTTFIKKTKFDFKATNYKILEETNVGDNRVLKGALFVGENASGKTQVLKAIKFLLDLLLENSEQDYIQKKSLYTKDDKFSLSYKFDIDNNELEYCVTFEKNYINSEKLYLNSELRLERLNTSGKTYFGMEKDNKNISPSLSLLKLEYYNTRFNNDVVLNKWFDFLKNSIYINCLFQDGIIKSYNPARISEQFLDKYAEKNKEKSLNNFLKKITYKMKTLKKEIEIF